jgi:hypothetical protein
LAAVLVASAGIAAAQSGDACTHDSFPVDGTPVAVTLCASPASANAVAIAETLTRGSATFNRSLSVEVVRGASVTRTVDDVPLGALGSTKLLHLTIAYRDGKAAIEHALLLPGAVVLK